MQVRWIAGLIAVSATMGLAACGDKVLDFRNAEISNNKIYGEGANVGFSGKVTNVPLNKLPSQQMAGFVKIVGNVSGERGFADLLFLSALSAISGNDTPGVLCDIQVREGSLQGKTVCKAGTGSDTLIEAHYQDNLLDGELVIHNPKKTDQVIGRAHYAKGKLEGKSEIFGTSNNRLLHQANWKDGLGEGREERWDEGTGKLVFEGSLKAGKYDGKAARYTPQGELIEASVYRDGVLEQTAPAAPPAQAATLECTDAWMAAFRKENGEEALIRADQISEWEAWCAQGKHPGQA